MQKASKRQAPTTHRIYFMEMRWISFAFSAFLFRYFAALLVVFIFLCHQFLLRLLQLFFMAFDKMKH